MKRALLLIVAGLIALAGCATPVAGQGSPAPVESPAATAARPTAPTEIRIPKLGITDDIVPVGLNEDGSLEVPDVHQTGYYNDSPAPGQPGPALLAGHVNYQGQVGALAHIGQLKPGDRVEVTTATGATAVFTVYKVDEQKKKAIDWVAILADRPDPELVIVTCSGQLIGHSYDSNTVVTARLIT
jgi:sortase (surface protein transpeptidase)